MLETISLCSVLLRQWFGKLCQFALDSGFSNLLADTMPGHHGSVTAVGTVYLLHFDRPYSGRMQHYVRNPRVRDF